MAGVDVHVAVAVSTGRTSREGEELAFRMDERSVAYAEIDRCVEHQQGPSSQDLRNCLRKTYKAKVDRFLFDGPIKSRWRV